MLFCVVAAYVAAQASPRAGLRLRELRLFEVDLCGWRVEASGPAVLLGLLLFNAGWRARWDRMKEIARGPSMVLAGLAANMTLPLLYLAALAQALAAWHDPAEASSLVVGLALVAAMPIAGSSTGWSQILGADMALSLGLVVGSTLVSPLITPMILGLVGLAAPATAATDLRMLSGRGTGLFLLAWVLAPSLLGMATRRLATGAHVERMEIVLKPASTLALLVICYSNAAVCLPQALTDPDWDYLLVVLAASTGLCTLTFLGGYAISRALGTERPQRTALMFGMGMNNNGTGLVLASTVLSSQPMTLVPIIIYNLVQQVVAGCVGRFCAADPA